MRNRFFRFSLFFLFLKLICDTNDFISIFVTGNRSLSSFANKSEHQVQGVSTRIRRSVHEPYQPCFTHFFLNDRPPSGFRADLTNIRYICQQIPIHEATFYATMFDIEDGIAVYSAYYITPQNANNIGAVPRQGAWREEPGYQRSLNPSISNVTPQLLVFNCHTLLIAETGRISSSINGIHVG